MELKASLLIPTYNGGELWRQALNAIDEQEYPFHQKIIVDSGSKDNTTDLARKHGFEVISIDQKKFNHGATRQLLADSADGSEVFVFMTQDAIPATNRSITNLLMAFDDPCVGVTYGRQLPHDHARPLESHLRFYNYPQQSQLKSFSDKDKLGFKVFFCSNSFAAYRKSYLNDVGGFPSDSIMGEDALTAAKMLLKGYKIAYKADATVRHSHSYTFREDFKRYFDTRVFHEQNKWLIEQYGKPSGEGIRYVHSEIIYVLKNSPADIFKSFSSLLAKWLGYNTGKFYNRIPSRLLPMLSMHRSFWQ
jgi:rhamnosyltransferase